MQLKFTKMHGLGNDFLVLELVTQNFDLTPELIRTWGDRRTGIGFDQLLIVRPPSNPETDFRYQIFNIDGSEAQQCGNGARCIAKYVTHAGLTIKKSLRMDAPSGIVNTSILEIAVDSPNTSIVRVDMGVPCTKPSVIPFLTDEPAVTYTVDIGSQEIEFVPLSMGNPMRWLLSTTSTTHPSRSGHGRYKPTTDFPRASMLSLCKSSIASLCAFV